jgi:hypothetical protein
MLPKRPVSCLAVAVMPVGLLLLLIAIGGYVLKLFYPVEKAPAPAGSTTGSSEQAQSEPVALSLLPAAIPTTTQILVATASADAVKEKVFSLNVFGTVTERESPQGFRPEQWKTEGIVLTPPTEAASSSAWRITGNGWNVPLRTHSGAKWQDPVILGKFSSGRLAIVAYRTQRALLSVSRAGDIQVVQVLEDELSPLTVQGKDAWFVRTEHAEEQSVDQLPKGPSYLVRLSEQGTSSTVAQDPAVILELIPSPSPSTLAYLSSDGSLVIVSGEQLASEIKGWRPQAWLDGRYLLVSHGNSLGWVDRTNPKQINALAEFSDFIRGVSLSTTSVRSVLK